MPPTAATNHHCTAISVGEPYPGVVPNGAVFDAFAPGGSQLRIGLPMISRLEVRELQDGPLAFGVATDAGAIMTLWRFGRLPWLDAPYDRRAAEKYGMLSMPKLKHNDHAVVQMIIMDFTTTIVHGLRMLTLSPPQTMALWLAIRNQSNGIDDSGYDRMKQQTSGELGAQFEIAK